MSRALIYASRSRGAPSVGIRPFIEQAFAREHVSIDFAGFSGETLHGVMQEPLDKIRIGRIRPASVTIRMLLPDTTKPMVLPCRADDLADDPDYRERMTRLTSRHAHAIIDTVQELTRLGLLQNGTAEIRAHPCPPMFKLYILNGEEAFFGLYPIIRHRIPFASGDRDIYDLMGKDAVVFHHSVHSQPKPRSALCLPVAAPETGSPPSLPCRTRIHGPVASPTCLVKLAAALPRSRRSACRV